jgi:hypothetical protein
MSPENIELVVPVYLNQRIVFDWIATLQDGISTVTRVSSTEESKTGDVQRYGTSFGLSQAFSSLLKIDLSGERNKTHEGIVGAQRNEERVHTPPSLFQKLRSTLKQQGQLKEVTKNFQPAAGMTVEFSTTLMRNPFVHAIETMMGIFDMAEIFQDTPNKSSGKTKATGAYDFKPFRNKLEKFLLTLNTGNTTDIIGESLESGHKAVLTLEREYLNDPAMSDLVDGQFKVVGKIIRVMPEPSGSVNLFRKAALGAISPEILNQMVGSLSSAASQGNFKLPEIQMEIQGPVIQVLPVAIFS